MKFIYIRIIVLLLPIFSFSQIGPLPPLGACVDDASGGTWYWEDLDGDGFGSTRGECLTGPTARYTKIGGDCNDNSTALYPRMWYLDADRDGKGNPLKQKWSCNPLSGYVTNGDDCNDNDRTIHTTRIWYLDNDGDGYGRSSGSKSACSPPSGYVIKAGDCNDNNSNINPDTSEGCSADGIDNNCNGKIDESIPNIPTATVSNQCGKTTITQGSHNTSTETWYWQPNATSANPLNSAGTITPNSGNTIYLRARNNASGCWGPSKKITYIIKAIPPTPPTPSVSNQCGKSVLTRGAPPSGITWYWQSSSGGTSISNASTSLTRTGGNTYYLRPRNNSSGCWGTSRKVNYSIKAIAAVPSAPTVSNQCGKSILTRSNPPSGITWYWQSSSGGTSLSNANASITRINGTRYYLRARNNSSGCWSTARTVNYSIKVLPTTPPTPSKSNQCGKTVLTRGTPPSGITWYWQSSGSGTSTSNANVSVTKTSGSSYFIRPRNNTTRCWGAARGVIYNINQIPATPPAPTVSNQCGKSVLTRTAPPSGITWYWQSSSTGTSISNANASIIRTTGNRYYLRSRNNTTGCWGAARTVNYFYQTIPATPPTPTVSNQCGKSVLTRTAPPSGITWYWQSSASGISTSNTSTALTRTSGNVYYLRARNDNTRCWGEARTVNYSIKAVPAKPTVAGVSNQCGKSILTRNNPPGNVTWYWQSSASGTSTSNSASSITRTSGTAYYLRARHNISLCWSTAVTVGYSFQPIVTWYQDSDGDGFASTTKAQCTSPGSGYTQTVLPLTDCNDNDASKHPGTIWYADTDTDGFGDPVVTKIQCIQPVGYVSNKGDLCISVKGELNGCEELSYQQPSLSDTENYVFTQSFQTPMTTTAGIQQEADVIESVAYYDGLGRSKQQVAIKASPTSSNTSVINELSIDWTSGQGGTGFFNRNGNASENHREIGVDPGGNLSMLWQCGNDAVSNADGGWNTDTFNVDKAVGYRYTVWVKRTGSQNGTTYHGTNYVSTLEGVAQPNPYFWYGDLPQLDTWYLMVGVIYPHNYNGADQGVSGVYDQTGNRVIDGKEFKWNGDTTFSKFRSYLYYSTDVNTNQFFWNPVVQKLDGSQTPLQELISGPQGEISDIVTHIEYDAYGRQAKQYLPYASQDNGGSYKNLDIISDINSYYQNKYAADFIDMALEEVNAYSERIYEASPLNRVLEQGAPGKDWKVNPNSDADHTIKFDRGANAANEVVHFIVDFADPSNTEMPTLVKDGFYAANELYVSITKNENWTPADSLNHATKEYKDKQGQVVLKQTFNESIAHDTYYVYDNYGSLTYVIPPKVTTDNGVSASELAELCYQYKYDYINRLIEKKIPGKGDANTWESIVYNKLDQPILTQDPNQKTKGEWLFTKYDVFGRVAYTGKVTDNRDRKTIQEEATAYADDLWVERGDNVRIGEVDMYYTDGGYPKVTPAEVLTINYYDDYGFLGSEDAVFGNPFIVYDEAITTKTKSLATGSKVKVLGTFYWTTTVSYYDKKARPIYVASHNEYLNTTDIIESKLDFIGKVLETKTTHTKGSNEAIVTIDTFEYDHMGRVMKQAQKINSQAKELITANSYDALGQLTSKRVGDGLQDVNYNYNVRGWLKEINDVNNMGNDVFAFGINYNTTSENLDAAPLYNGNISETLWKTTNDNIKRAYGYQYDALNRLTLATITGNRYDMSAKYDKNGNIINLNRQGWQNTSNFFWMDVLSYEYDAGNKLRNVTDTGNSIYGYKQGTNTNDDFVYDANGNMTIDRNKGITGIRYNHLNLPETVSISNTEGTGNITYIYDATGAKLKKIVTEGSSLIETEYTGNYVYKNGTLEFFNHPEGIVEKEADGYKYVYQFKDHLGNVRLSYKDADKNGSITQSEIIQEKNYYPFGLTHKGYNDDTRGRNHNYGFNGQETDKSLGLNVSEMTFRQYDPAIGRFNVIDAAAELAQNWTPYRFGFNNPIKFSDPSGLWEIKDGNWYTNDSKDIERFVNMLGFEKSNTGEEASIAQIDTFLSEEFRGSGGRLSDGSALLDSETIVADSNGNSNGFSERQAFHIGSQVENFGSNPWNEKSGLYNNPFYSYKYYRERSWESRGGSFPGIKLGFFGSKYAQSLLYNPGNWWYSTKVNKFYDWSFTGNGHTGGRNKYIGNISKKWSKYAGNAGKAFGVYSLYNTAGQYQDGTLTSFGAAYIGGVDGAALGSKNLNVAAWSLGTGIGKSIVESNWYFNAVHNDINW